MSDNNTFAPGLDKRNARLRRPSGERANNDFAVKRMKEVDAFPPEVRSVIHVAGLSFVKTMMQLGITSAKQMWHVLEQARGVAMGDEGIRDAPNEGEITFIAQRLAVAYARTGHVPTSQDREAAKIVASGVWSHLRWGRCMCFGTLPIVYRPPVDRDADHNYG